MLAVKINARKDEMLEVKAPAGPVTDASSSFKDNVAFL